MRWMTWRVISSRQYLEVAQRGGVEAVAARAAG